MAKSNLISNAFIKGKYYNVHFSITVLAEIIIPVKNVQPNETIEY